MQEERPEQQQATVPARTDEEATAVQPQEPAGVPQPQAAEEGPALLPASHGLTGLQKMAILLVALGPERAKAVLQNFEDDEIERIVREIANMRYITAEQREAVLQEAYEYIFGEDTTVMGRLMAGRQVAREILVEAVGGVRARNILDRLDIPQTDLFYFVGDNDLENLAYFLENQLPQIAAVTLLHLRPEQGQRVLERLPSKLQAEVIARMVEIDKVDRRVVEMLRETLEKQLEISRNLVNLHGQEGATNILRRVASDAQQEVLEAIGETNATLRQRLEEQLVTFDDLAEIDDREFGMLLNRVNAADRELLPLALKSCSERMRNKIYSNLTATRREEIEYRLETMPRRRLSEVERAQRRIVEIALQMANEGLIVFGGSEPLV